MLAQDAPRRLESITSESLNSRDVIGRLGLPLGDVTEIVATVVSGDSTRLKANAGQYLLRVHSVGGKELKPPLLMNFHVVIGSDAQLASDDFALYKLKKGEETGSLESGQIKELEKGYVDSKVKLLVYETGSYEGFPKGNPFGVAGRAFHFGTYLDILVQHDLP
ncbi:MAG: hypothetical protein V4719_22435 [Planctomycetota bacterium]